MSKVNFKTSIRLGKKPVLVCPIHNRELMVSATTAICGPCLIDACPDATDSLSLLTNHLLNLAGKEL